MEQGGCWADTQDFDNKDQGWSVLQDTEVIQVVQDQRQFHLSFKILPSILHFLPELLPVLFLYILTSPVH